jgi:4-hydroxy-L-threonine phosphate dehydrogenase PdxA
VVAPLIGVVIGDPAGVGPEICVKALAGGRPQARGRFVLIGNIDALERARAVSSLDVRFVTVASPAAARDVTGAIPVIDDGRLGPADYRTGEASAACGRATYARIGDAIASAERGEIEGVIIAPIDATSLKLAGYRTEAMPEMHPPNTYLLRITGALRTMPIGEHVLMRDVPRMVTKARVLEVILLLARQMRAWGFAPKLAVAGLNPHCIGEEDAEEIAPAVAAAREQGFDVTGPLSPDTVFRAGVAGSYDAIVTMYHDQGQIATKTVGLEEACAVFVGLPYVRVGIPHGSAFDIAGKGIAQCGTAVTAMTTAASLAAGAGVEIA